MSWIRWVWWLWSGSPPKCGLKHKITGWPSYLLSSDLALLLFHPSRSAIPCLFFLGLTSDGSQLELIRWLMFTVPCNPGVVGLATRYIPGGSVEGTEAGPPDTGAGGTGHWSRGGGALEQGGPDTGAGVGHWSRGGGAPEIWGRTAGQWSRGPDTEAGVGGPLGNWGRDTGGGPEKWGRDTGGATRELRPVRRTVEQGGGHWNRGGGGRQKTEAGPPDTGGGRTLEQGVLDSYCVVW